MMNEDVDIDAPLEEALQHGMAISAQIGRELARAWRAHLEDKARTDDRTAALVQRAFNTERDTAAAALAPAQDPKWWDEASVREICDAYQVANTWAEHDPRAAQAEETIRMAAAERYGIDPERLLTEGHRQTETIMNTPPERLAQAQRWARLEGWTNDIPEFYPEAQKLHNLLSDYDRAVSGAERSEALADQARREAELKDDESKDLFGEAGRGHEHADGLDREALEPSPEDLDKARAWAMANDPEYADKSQSEKDRLDRELVESWRGVGDPEKAQEAGVVRKDAAQRERAGEKAAVAAGAAYDNASRLEADAARMRAAGAPERGIEAKQFGLSQQKYPVAHAAAGKGKSTGKVTTNSVKLAQSQSRHLGR
ncbi:MULTISPECIES: hypothetical protein [Paenarthrobacter]|uniref:Uncharacterized protein n=1 Tax=Paenarthrobacter ureafaciens TaxID=37931 RepID=A0AAX3EQW8_PAEUR|nr:MULTISPECIES: hypothetical protein [Paenarthrobacter]MDO5867120.1 hypothetical protein [Paenarthrobacter sp. SD-2]MDO5878374.1 hypothetical protein [Paenarthrobacter sp. SD-1]UYV95601.1 hypothetical protein NL395_23335 [Paenarthrobacter ureafaciens]UYW00244.1 hypothetical protein NL394_24145 [Paenarthrobacter ureafaciens]